MRKFRTLAQENCFNDFPKLKQGGVGGMPGRTLPELAQNSLRFRCAGVQCRGILDHLVILLGHLVGGSDKMSAASLLGGIRTYVHLGQQPFTYENWLAAVQAGNTFVTVGPLAKLTVEGLSPGSRLNLRVTGGTVSVSWKVEPVSLPIDQVEIVVGGLTAEQVTLEKKLSASGSAELKINASTWIALRVRGSYRGTHGEIAAHTSAVQVLVADKPLFSPGDAAAVLDQIEGAIAYVDTIAPRPEARRYKQLRATLEAAHQRLHQRMHRHGLYHRHNPLHHQATPHEH